MQTGFFYVTLFSFMCTYKKKKKKSWHMCFPKRSFYIRSTNITVMFKMDVCAIAYLILLLSFAGTSDANESLQCPENYFLCDKRICISSENVCDGIRHCKDGTDEKCQEPVNETEDLDGETAAVAAARYLQAQLNPNWDDFAPRTAIALSFLGPLSPLSDKEKHSLVEKIKVQLLMMLKEGIDHIKLHTLALYINALYASCEDPRLYYDNNDLVEILRVETDRAKENFNLPVVILTLCLSKEVRFDELNKLIKMYDDRRNFRIGNKALALIVMAACKRQGTADHYHEMRKRMDHFVRHFKNLENIGAYSKALIHQAYNAWGLDTSALRSELLKLQAKDGSFQDVLATYAAIPALLNTSLANLQCKTRVYLEKSNRRSGTAVQLFNPQRFLEYTMSIPVGQENIGNHSLTLQYEGRMSLFQLMKRAEDINPMFSFTYDNVEGTGIKITSLGGISNDAESGLEWTLYKRTNDPHSAKDTIESGELDLVYPQDGSHYIFKLEYNE